MTKRWYVVPFRASKSRCSAHDRAISVPGACQDKVRPGAGARRGSGRNAQNGQKSISSAKFFPGYVLVEMEMNDDSWHLVKSTPKVTGFIGGTPTKPTPISERKSRRSCTRSRKGVEKPRPKVLFEVGEAVRASRTVRLPTSTAMSRKSITRRAGCACR